MNAPADPRVWRPNPGPQAEFLSCGAYEVLYGGRAGGGKSDALIVSAIRLAHSPHYHALLLRRTVAELSKSGGLLERCWAMLPALGAHPTDGGKCWTWGGGGPAGGRLDLAGMEHENDRFAYLGSEYHWIGFDELCTFTERQYKFMHSRLRPTHGLPVRARAATNPDGEGLDWVRARWAPWVLADAEEYTGEIAYPGQRLFYVFDDERDEHVRCDPMTPGAVSRTYFPASYLDTPQLGAQYVASLNELDPLTRKRIKDGSWTARATSGLMFRREKLRIRGAVNRQIVTRVRAWDLAATPRKIGRGDDPAALQAASAGVLIARDVDGHLWIEDVVRIFGRPSEVRARVVATAKLDDQRPGPRALISLPLDPGQASHDQRELYAEALSGFWWEMTPERGDKIERAKPLSSEVDNDRVSLVFGEWNEPYVAELVDFPFGRKDQVDASTRGYSRVLLSPTLVPTRDQKRAPARETARGTGGY